MAESDDNGSGLLMVAVTMQKPGGRVINVATNLYAEKRRMRPRGERFVTHLLVTVDCYIERSVNTGCPARLRRYVAHMGGTSFDGNGDVSIQEFVLDEDGKPKSGVQNPFSIGGNGAFRDQLGRGINTQPSGQAYQYFEATIANTSFIGVPVPIAGQVTPFNYIDFSNNLSVNGDSGLPGLRICTRKELDEWARGGN